MDAVHFLFSLERFGIKLGLENVSTICDALGRPQEAFPSILIAGTNGKGSVAALVEAALRAAGYRTGRYTSPHLVHLEERFAIDGESIATDRLEAVAGEVRSVIEEQRGGERLPTFPTFFEATTAVAFELFRRERVAVAVLEVGLGGRFDATNIVRPVASAITSIDLDHERFLGDTLAEIAFEKAGIIKPGVPTVVGPCADEAWRVIERVARDVGASLVRSHDDVEHQGTPEADGRTRLEIVTPRGRYGPLTLALRGDHQVRNAVVAIRLLEMLDQRGLAVPTDAIVRAFSTVRWPGRLDLVAHGTGRWALLDAAHNPAGAAALAAYLERGYPPLPIVFGAMRDKNSREMLRVLAPRASHFVFTEPSSPRAATAEELSATLRAVSPNSGSEIQRVPGDAIAAAWRLAPIILVAGSLFLVGDVLQILRARDARTRV